MSNKGASGAGMGFFTLLGVLFIGLRLANVIDWPWWVVLAPIWGPAVLVVVILTLISVISQRSERKNRS
jgi:MFS superfamily sulfate permease-like transporter